MPATAHHPLLAGDRMAHCSCFIFAAARNPLSDAFVLFRKPVPIVVSASGEQRPHVDCNRPFTLTQRLIFDAYEDLPPLFRH